MTRQVNKIGSVRVMSRLGELKVLIELDDRKTHWSGQYVFLPFRSDNSGTMSLEAVEAALCRMADAIRDYRADLKAISMRTAAERAGHLQLPSMPLISEAEPTFGMSILLDRLSQSVAEEEIDKYNIHASFFIDGVEETICLTVPAATGGSDARYGFLERRVREVGDAIGHLRSKEPGLSLIPPQ